MLSVVLAVIAAAVFVPVLGITASLAVGGYVVAWYQRTTRLSKRSRKLADRSNSDLAEQDGEGTLFQRFILGEFRAKHGIPTYTKANLIMVRRAIFALLKEERPDMRGVDLEKHCREITHLAFVPSVRDVEYANALATSHSGWLYWLFGFAMPARCRMDELVRPQT